MKGYERLLFYVICHSVCHVRDIHAVVAIMLWCGLGRGSAPPQKKLGNFIPGNAIFWVHFSNHYL